MLSAGAGAGQVLEQVQVRTETAVLAVAAAHEEAVVRAEDGEAVAAARRLDALPAQHLHFHRLRLRLERVCANEFTAYMLHCTALHFTERVHFSTVLWTRTIRC